METASMRKAVVAIPGIWLLMVPALRAAGEPIRLVPPPKEVAWSEAGPIGMNAGKVAIVIGQGATAPERYAAERLQQRVQRRYGQTWPIVSEQEMDTAMEVLIVLGQRSTNALMDLACRAEKLKLDASTPGHDGYVIAILERSDGHTVLVGGSNPRGVIYGQDTLFQLLQQGDDRLEMTRASVRDWPTVPWRGRPQTHYENYLREGDWDCYLDARINFVDLRSGTYAFEPGAELDKETIGKVVDEAHRRGLIVYATVNCGVTRKEYPEAVRTFTEMIELGADGLWISFDDKGPGEEPETIVRQTLALGQEHGITGRRIAVCPPKGSYQDFITPFNKWLATVDGMEQALWFLTRLPAWVHLEQARSIGLESKPGWWHNWPRLYREHWYVEPISMQVGWHSPTYATLADGGECIDAVMPWGGNAWGQYYVATTIGWWGWNPAAFDWAEARGRIYDTVFGRDMIATATAFDDTLVGARSHITYSSSGSEWKPYCPMRLNDPADRNAVQALTGRMHMLLNKLEKQAPNGTLIPPAVLKEYYLDRMAREVDSIETAARLSYPEYWWLDHQERVLTAIYDDDLAKADALIEEVRPGLMKDLTEIERAGDCLRRVDAYAAWWKNRANLDAAGWQALVEARRSELTARLKDYSWHVAVPGKLLEPLDDPPLDRGTGRWQDGNFVLEMVVPSPREYAWGHWIAGVTRVGGHEVAVFTAERKSGSMPGEFCELEVTLPIPDCRRDRLWLLLFSNSANKDDIGLQHVIDRWAGYRFVELRWGDRLLWESDLGLTRERGRWDMVKLPTIPEDVDALKLRLRAVDRKMVTVNHTIAFVGPIRLIERQECPDGL